MKNDRTRWFLHTVTNTCKKALQYLATQDACCTGSCDRDGSQLRTRILHVRMLTRKRTATDDVTHRLSKLLLRRFVNTRLLLPRSRAPSTDPGELTVQVAP